MIEAIIIAYLFSWFVILQLDVRDDFRANIALFIFPVVILLGVIKVFFKWVEFRCRNLSKLSERMAQYIFDELLIDNKER